MTSTSKPLLLFLCLAQNCERTIPNFLDFLQDLRAVGFECYAIIGENGSTDRSRELIKSAYSQGVELLDTGDMSQHPNRLHRMAVGRDLLLHAARNRISGPGAFICVADLDNVFEQPPDHKVVRQVISRLTKEHSLFAVGATSYPYYYDLLSMRAAGHDYSSLNAEIAKAKKNPFTYYGFHENRIYANQRAITAAGPIVCLSSFNGFCVYNANSYLAGTYLAENMDNVCEHVTMNSSIHTNTGQMMQIDPFLRIMAPSDHRPVGQVRFYLDRMQELALRLLTRFSF